MEEDPDIEILKAKKMQEMMQRMIKQKKEKIEKSIRKREPSEREILLSYLYDRGDEVLNLALTRHPEFLLENTEIMQGAVLNKEDDKKPDAQTSTQH